MAVPQIEDIISTRVYFLNYCLFVLVSPPGLPLQTCFCIFKTLKYSFQKVSASRAASPADRNEARETSRG